MTLWLSPTDLTPALAALPALGLMFGLAEVVKRWIELTNRSDAE